MKNKFNIFIAFIAAFAGILFGYDTGVISGAIIFIGPQFKLSSGQYELVVSAVLFGAFLGAIFSGRLADRYGRKYMLITDSIIFMIGTLATCLANDVTLLILSRIVVGIAIGISSYVGPLYISEISPTKYRGALVSLNQLAITIGILISYVVDYAYTAHGDWRMMFAIGIIPAICLLLGMLFLPHSPRWALSRGEEQQALNILNRIHGHAETVQRQFDLIKSSLEQQKGTWKLLFSKKIRPTLLIAAGLAFIQQITGINTIIYYAPTIFKMAGYHSAHAAILTSVGVGVVFVIFTIIALFLIDTLGRRPLLFIGLTAMTISLGAMSWAFHTHNPHIIKAYAVSGMWLFISGFAISLGPIMWLMIAEVFPLKVRGLGSSLATCVNWASNWAVAITFITLINHGGLDGAFFIFFICSLLSLLFIYLLIPETKGISLEQIELNLYAGKSTRELGAP